KPRQIAQAEPVHDQREPEVRAADQPFAAPPGGDAIERRGEHLRRFVEGFVHAALVRGARARAGRPAAAGGARSDICVVEHFLLMCRCAARLVDREHREGGDHDQADEHRGQVQRAGEQRDHSARLRARMGALAECSIKLVSARERLIEELREHALVIGEVTLTSGTRAGYYVDAKRAILRPVGFAALAKLVAAQGHEWQATAAGGGEEGAGPGGWGGVGGGARAKAFFVRKQTKEHGLQRRIEGPPLTPEDRCVVVEDVVTTGGSTLAAIAALNDEGHEICGVLSVLDRLAG